jgi:hypothetical protein
MRLPEGKTDHATTTTGEKASAEGSGSAIRKRLPWNYNRGNNAGRPPLSMYLVLKSILFVVTEVCSWRAIDRPQSRWNSVSIRGVH